MTKKYCPGNFRTRYDYSEPGEYSFHCEGESMTQQQFKEECDINNILAKYRRTGMLTHFAKHNGQFGDFSSFEDYQTSMEKVSQAQDSFDMLPSEVRTRFNNDPGLLIGFLADEKNEEEAIKLGLVKRKIETPSMQESFERALAANDVKRKSSKKPE